MIQGFAANSLMASAAGAAFYSSSPELELGETSTTFYTADPQCEHLGPRSMWDNAGIDYRIHSGHRPSDKMLLAAAYTDTLVTHGKRQNQDSKRIGIHVLGDVTETPSDHETRQFESILERHPELPVDGFDRGNHSSANFFGVINLRSRLNKWFRKWVFGDRSDTLDEQMSEAAGGKNHVLTVSKTFDAMHRALHRHRVESAGRIEHVNTAVSRADHEYYQQPRDPTPRYFNKAGLPYNFKTFWKASKGTKLASPQESPYWDCLVNYHLADKDAAERGTKVTPFYIQASQTHQHKLSDGRIVPVYSISLDTNDSDNPIAVFPGVSALQIRLIETFIDYVRMRQPDALFKLSAHFPAEKIVHQPRGIFGRLLGLINPFASRTVRTLFKELLSREEIISFTSAHTHDRAVNDLTKRLGLKRTTPLPEVVVPSLTDYAPVLHESETRPHDGRAIGIERMWAEQNEDGSHQLRIQMHFEGIDPEELLGKGLTPEVEEALTRHNRNHSYQRTLDTMLEKLGRPRWFGWGGKLGRQLWWNFLGKRAKSIWRFTHSIALPLPVLWIPFFWNRAKKYWFEHPSVIQDVKDALTTVSTEQMFNEAEHMMPFLRSLSRFIEKDIEAGHAASEAILTSVRNVHRQLATQYDARRIAFDAAVTAKEDASKLASYNDLFQRAEVFKLQSLLTGLKEDGEARAFAVMVGLESSRIEYEFQGLKPSSMPDEALNVTIPLG